MNWKEFYDIAKDSVIFSDGSMGVFLQRYGLKGGECPDYWNIIHPEIIEDVHKKYLEAGSNLITTNTFGANRIKLREFGLDEKIKEINSKGAKIARKVAKGRAIVAGDIGPTGKLLHPLGDLTFEEAYDIYREQIEILANSGVDCLLFETHIDILEIKAAIIAAKDVCDLPIIATVTFEKDGRMLTGTPPEAAFVTLEALGVDILGTNCGTGPQDMLNAIEKAIDLVSIPVIAQANAGLPELKDGITLYTTGPEEYSNIALKMIERGVSVIGGCCGTTPEHILLSRQKYLSKYKNGIRKLKKEENELIVSTRLGIARIGFDSPFAIIGERLNPTARKKLASDIKEGKFELFKDEALRQQEARADILDVNMGIPEIDEVSLMVEGINILSNLVKTPLSIDTSNPEVISKALKIYPGKLIINSISLEENKLKLLPLLKKYGAAFIALPVDRGIPKTAEERLKNMKRLLQIARSYGIEKKNILADPLVLTVSSEQQSPQQTLKTIRAFRNELKVFTTLGLSNVSFGLPAREHLNRSFLAMAIECGLTSAILNPFDTELVGIIKGSDVLLGKDKNGEKFISIYSEKKSSVILPEKEKSETTGEKLFDCVLKGNKEVIEILIKESLEKGYKPFEILDKFLIPAITEVGKLYEERVYFLPQLMRSAETMKTAFNILEPLLREEGGSSLGKIVFATVKGDVHDIGKNIVILMLRNHGFEVYDLGKDVPNEVIFSKAIEVNANIVALSSLMTTTMPMMKEFMELQKRKGTNFKVMVGGAAVTKSFAESINAYYSPDAVDAVKLAKKLVSQ